MMMNPNNYNDYNEMVGKIVDFDGLIGKIDYCGTSYYFSFENLNERVNVGDFVRFYKPEGNLNIVNEVKKFKQSPDFEDYYNEIGGGELRR